MLQLERSFNVSTPQIKMQQFIQRLQCMPERIRNITIVAHIDHGKTTLADTLLSTNEIINQKQQGKQRFLDYLPIEQERLITVKSSSVSLVHMTENSFACSQIKKNGEIPKKGFFLAQLYDSPGHVDFTHEVLMSLSMSDGAIFVVDIVEGLRTQSQNLLKSLMRLNLQLVLVINKVDRLFTELKMTPFEAFIKIQQMIADTNNCIETMNLDMSEYFSLTKNVMIASAYSGWGVSLLQFISNLPIIDQRFSSYSKDELLEFLGSSDSYMTTNGEIKAGKPQNCLYVKYILEPLKRVYELTEDGGDIASNTKKLLKIHKTFTGKDFGTLSQNAESCRTDLLFDIFPLGKQLLDMVVYNVPSPIYTQNAFIVQIEKQINAIKPFQFIGLIGKHLTDIHIDEPQQQNNSLQGRHFSLMRIIWTGQQGDFSQQELLYGNNITYQTNYNQQFNIVNVYQPLGRLFKHIEYRLISQGNIIGIETNIPVHNNSLVIGSFLFDAEPSKSDSENDFGQLMVRASSTSHRQVSQGQLISDDVVNEVHDIYMKLQESCLGYEKPLIKVCLLPDKIQNYNDLCEAVKILCETQMSVEWELSRNGDITLFVCGDVHLDLCLEALREIIDFDFHTSTENISIFETYANPEIGQFQLPASKSPQEVLFEYNKSVLEHLNGQNDSKKLTTIPILSGQQREVFLPYYYEFIGQNAQQKPAYGMEVAILNDNVVERLKLFISLSDEGDIEQEAFQIQKDELENVLLIHQSVPDKLRAVLRLAFSFNMSQGILSLEPVRGCKLAVYCQNEGKRELNIEGIQSDYEHFFLRPGVGVLWVLNDVAHFIRCFFSRLRPRIVEECYDVVITIPEIAQQGVQRLLKKCRASQIQYFGVGNDGDVVFEVHAVVPQEYCLSLGAQLRSDTAGAGTIQFPARRLRINDEDPRGVKEADDEEEEDQTNIKNNATRLLEKILTQKGLYVGEVVEAAEKQRTRRK